MPKIYKVCLQYPKHRYSQKEITEKLLQDFEGDENFVNGLKKFHSRVGVEYRSTALPIEEYAKTTGHKDRNDRFIQIAKELAEKSINKTLESAKVRPQDIDLIVSNTTTGISVPSLEARLMNKIDFSANCKRLPIYGLGCMGGAAGVHRVCEYLKGSPTSAALFFFGRALFFDYTVE